ncbi:MAG: septum formation initiator family protein [Treponema sp.]|nr:septum formation initiator family protein [Treponema sp.]
MKTGKYLPALLAGTLAYALLSFFWGQNSVWAQKQLEEQKKVISARTQEIQNINDELNLEKTAIRDDADVIAAYARKLDYVFPGEKLVKIKGLGAAKSLMYETGSVLKSAPVAYVSEWFCKGAGLAVGLLLALAIFLFDLSYGVKSLSKKKRFETIEGIPVYDVAQV